MDIHTCEYRRLGAPDAWNWRQEMISGPYWRAYWNDSPGAFVKVAGKEVELGPGKIVALPPRTVYSSRTELSVWHLFMHFSVERPYSQVAQGIYVFKSNRLISLASAIARDFRNRHSYAKIRLKAEVYLCEILLSLPEKDLPVEKKLDPRIVKALKILEASQPISNLELTRKTGMNRTSFSELFHQQTGTTPQAFSRKSRLEKAFLMLHFEDKSIERIAAETGFCDRYHFGRAFKREFGITPARYRKQPNAF